MPHLVAYVHRGYKLVSRHQCTRVGGGRERVGWQLGLAAWAADLEQLLVPRTRLRRTKRGALWWGDR